MSSTGQAMEDALDLYAEPHDLQRPAACFDDTPRNFCPMSGRPSRWSRENRGARTTSTAGGAHATSS